MSETEAKATPSAGGKAETPKAKTKKPKGAPSTLPRRPLIEKYMPYERSSSTA